MFRGVGQYFTRCMLYQVNITYPTDAEDAIMLSESSSSLLGHVPLSNQRCSMVIDYDMTP